MPTHTLPDGATLRYEWNGIEQGIPLILLHSGWGQALFGWARQHEFLATHGYPALAYDRRGYGQSSRVTHLPIDFHARAAEDLWGLIDGLGLRDVVLWGHSDGAVIATFAALRHPARVRGLIFEGGHYYRAKPGSRPFFLRARDEPLRFGANAARILGEEHGSDYWATLIGLQAGAWLAFESLGGDLYDGRLTTLTLPTLILHGTNDEFTPVSEIETMAATFPSAQLHLIPEGTHCPHHAPLFADFTNHLVLDFLRTLPNATHDHHPNPIRP
jgi:pimeloyl-ACP methyl ester carboxylesterase